MKPFRYIEEEGELSTAEGLAGDEAIALGISQDNSPTTLRLYHYVPSAIVGRFQNLTDAINLDVCKESGLEWNRRHSGGGTVMMGPDQVAVALTIPDKQGRFIGDIRRHFNFFASIFSDALSNFGIESQFLGKNDLCIGGRKVAGLAISQDLDGVVFFHASLLLDFDVNLMVRVLDLPTDQLDDKGQSCFAQRMTTVREHNPSVTFEKMKIEIVKSLEDKLGQKATKGTWTDFELSQIENLYQEKYKNDDWIYSTRVMRRWKGSAEAKTSGGNLKVYVDASPGVLNAVLITGDYFGRNIDIATLESNLKGTPAKKEEILKVIQSNNCELIYQVEAEKLAELVLVAHQSILM